MSREEEIAARRYHRFQRWHAKLPPEQKTAKVVATALVDLEEQGLADANGLTTAGELRLHQLELLQWMAEHPRK